jgi:GINS complex subunit 3
MLAVSSPSSNKSLVSLHLPSSLAPRVVNALKADPKSIDLRALAQHFYGLGSRLLELLEEEELCDVLMESWKKRAVEIQDQAGNLGGGKKGGGRGVGNDRGHEFLTGLDESERALFRASHDGARGMKSWVSEVKKS